MEPLGARRRQTRDVAAVSGALAFILTIATACLLPSASPTELIVVDTPDEALAAVIEQRPDLAGADPLWDDPPDDGPIVGRRPIGGGGTSVGATTTPDGIELTFTTRFGDCPSGCTDVRVEVFLVTPDGAVSSGCSMPAEPSPEASMTPGTSSAPDPRPTHRVLPATPCVPAQATIAPTHV